MTDYADLRARARAIEQGADRAGDAAVIGDVGPQPFATVEVLAGDPPPPPSLHVASLLADQDVNLWTGFGGSGKSILSLHTALCIASGRPVFGTLAVRRPGAVLLVCPEDGQAAVRMMLDALGVGMGMSAAERARLVPRVVMVSDEAAINLAADMARLRATAEACHAVLVILDPLRNLLGASEENSNDLAGAVCDAMRRQLCRGAGSSVLADAHNRKPSKGEPIDVAASRHDTRGASGWVDGARLVFGIQAKGNQITMTGVKANRLKSGITHDLTLTIDAPPDDQSAWRSCAIVDRNAGAVSESYTPGAGRALTVNERTLLGCLDDRFTPGQLLSYSRWFSQSALPETTFKRCRTALISAGFVTAIPTGTKTRRGGNEYSYGITDKGRGEVDVGAQAL